MSEYFSPFDRSIKQVILISDSAIEPVHDEVPLIHLVKLFQKEGLNIAAGYSDMKNILGDGYQPSLDEDKFSIENSILALTDEIDRNLLKDYSKAPFPILYEMLEDEAAPLSEILFRAFKLQAERDDTIHFDGMVRILNTVRKNNPRSHTLFAFLKNHMIVPGVVSGAQFNYHQAGRGFYGLATQFPLYGHKANKPSPYGFNFDIYSMSNLENDDKKKVISEFFIHEFYGHTLNGLKDHHSSLENTCVMSTSPTITDYLRKAEKRSEQSIESYFCERCNDLIGKNNSQQQPF